MVKNKKALLIFFGEYRSFDVLIPQLQDLDKVDIILSTWSETKRNDSMIPILKDKVYELIPHIKQCHIINPNDIPNIDSKWNTWKMYWHWKNAINNIDNPEDYDVVILHRCDLLSNWHEILNVDIKDDTVYFHHGKKPYFEKHHNAFWINDYYLFGKYNIIKDFVNRLDEDNYHLAHTSLWDVVTKYDFKYEHFLLRGYLIRDDRIELFEDLNSRNEKYNDFGCLTGPE